MFKLFTTPKAQADQAGDIADAARRFLRPAMRMAVATPATFLTSPFLRGYFMGVLDAFAMHQGSASEDDPLLIGVAFLRLCPGCFEQYASNLRLADDAGYCAGMASGGMAVYRSLTSDRHAGLDVVPILKATGQLSEMEGEPEAKVAAMAAEIRAKATSKDEFNLVLPAAFARHFGRPFNFDDADDLALAEATLWATFSVDARQ